MINYLIGFWYQGPTGPAFGHITLPLTDPVRNQDDIEVIAIWLRQHGYPQPGVMSFSRFEDDPAGGQTR